MTIKALSKIMAHLDPNTEIKLRIESYEDFGEDGYDNIYNEYSFDEKDIYLDDYNNLIIEP